MRLLRVALCQTPSVSSRIPVAEAKATALRVASEFVDRAKAAQPQTELIVLPEMFACPYGTQFFRPFAEPLPPVGAKEADIQQDSCPSIAALAQLAARHAVWLVGGSVAEIDSEGRLFNTSVVFDSSGTVVAKHRKLHLFDIDVPGKIKFMESETLSPGDRVTTFDSPWGTIGLGICYDVRFAEAALLMRQRGAKLLIYPGAFNTTTGPAHWRLLMQGRALDTQCFVLGCSPARATAPQQGDYLAWGHSIAVDPWGEIKVELEEHEGIAHAELDLDRLEEVRQSIPISKQRKEGAYKLVDVAQQ